jgi:ABC-2 type transport system ATP-binding protein
MSVIETNKLSKTYKGKRGATVTALNGLDLSLEQGEVFGFLGPNGAGKSTTIKLLMGLITPTSGTATIHSIPVSSTEARKSVGFLPENPAFYDYLTAEEYLMFVGSQFGMQGDHLKQRCQEALKLFDLQDAGKRPMRGYSKGMVQRLGLAQVVVHDPDIYILDEPMSGLDPLGRALVKDVILKLKQQGKTIFFSTHITADVEQVCDRVGVILKGELKSVEKVAAIMTTGVSGYHLRIQNRDGNVMEETVPPALLSAVMRRIEDEGGIVSLVEPVRKDLEQFFLDIVGAG